MLRTLLWVSLAALLGAAGMGCGSRSEPLVVLDSGAGQAVRTERCNGVDDDGKNGVDDPFRDADGRYVSDAHCGACNQACSPRPDSELETHCKVVDGVPRCTASKCVDGFAPTRDGRCAKRDERLCLACASDDDCGALTDARCASIASESRCTVGCALGCPAGFACDTTRDLCVPEGGSCSCDPGDRFDYACVPDDSVLMPQTPVCVGRASCDNGVVTACAVAEETCDEQDNDCDGEIDEGFRDALGAYSLDPENCGQCGSSCLEETGFDQKLVCGGDPFAPRCALACPDAVDGVTPGDRLDGDLDLATGCECVVQSLTDDPGPVGREGELLDENCDGADGLVRESFYVAGDGDDDNPGSPTRPLRTIGAALLRARDSLRSEAPRPHVYVASGSYTETVRLVDGVQVHGGYRRDFRALDPKAFVVEVRAPRPSGSPGGAALVAIDVGAAPTRIEWMSLRGLDAAESGAALGAYVERPGPNLVLSALTLQAGVPTDGSDGADGEAGAGPGSIASVGGAPRGAREDGAHSCLVAGQANVVRGGAGGQAVCGGVNVSGGSGGQASCPGIVLTQAAGAPGRGAGAGSGGQGGQDAQGPLNDPVNCPNGVCCGLADFQVPTDFEGPGPGQNGGDGVLGNPGLGCGDARGQFVAGVWSGSAGRAGGDGQPGSGGGGGGSGGGVVMNWVDQLCEYPDGLGGGGGGGGGGGCGGRGGRPGSSGAPSVALLVVDARRFSVRDVLFVAARGGRGGNGGAGGDGGAGGTGAAGGALALTQRTTPTLAGPFPGARGGSGGSGGAGGSGGGGCGGSSAGVWLVGGADRNWVASLRNNRFQLAGGGEGGEGGGGAQPGSRGANGEVIDVFAQ